MTPPISSNPSFSHRLQTVAMAINNSATRNDPACMELAKNEVDRLCAEADAMEAKLNESPVPPKE